MHDNICKKANSTLGLLSLRRSRIGHISPSYALSCSMLVVYGILTRSVMSTIDGSAPCGYICLPRLFPFQSRFFNDQRTGLGLFRTSYISHPSGFIFQDL